MIAPIIDSSRHPTAAPVLAATPVKGTVVLEDAPVVGEAAPEACTCPSEI